jgi:hypothetical protein
MKQDSDAVATWRPSREDFVLTLCEHIDVEESTREERAADRAERFGGYLDKRLDEAGTHADSFDAGPSVHAHQNQQRAERQAKKHDKLADKACLAYHKAEYWQYRVAGVIQNALHLEEPNVRARRIKEMKKEIARELKAVEYWSDSKYSDSAQHAQRWADHLTMRLTYETAIYSAQVGETFESLDIVKGGTVGNYIIHRVNKSKLSGEVNSIGVLGTQYNSEVPAIVTIKTATFKASSYEAPTPESLEQLKAEKLTLRGNREKPISTINPTPEDAQKLQDIWNAQRKEGTEAPGIYECSQARFSDYRRSQMTTIYSLDKYGQIINYHRNSDAEAVCKIRVRRAPMYDYGRPDSVISLNDKKQKPLPQFEVIPVEEVTA